MNISNYNSVPAFLMKYQTASTTTTTTTSTTTTTTTVQGGFQHFRNTTGQSNSTNACNQTTTTAIYSLLSDPIMDNGIVLYVDSLLTNPFNGNDLWYKILWQGTFGGGTLYGTQISTGGVVLRYGTCPITTTTTSTTSTTTTSTTSTTTTINAFAHLRSLVPQTNSTNACNQSASTLIYGSLGETNMAIGNTLYTNSSLTTTFNGNSQWFKIIWKGSIGFNSVYGVQISSVGVVQSFVTCP